MPSASGPQLVAYELTLVTVAVALTAYVVWRGSADAVVPTFVVELGRSSSVGLRDRLARLLGDPSLVLGFAVGDRPATSMSAVSRSCWQLPQVGW